MGKKSIQVLREIQGKDIAGIQCLYCMDTRECSVCNGVGKVPGAVNGRITPVECWNCEGGKKCPKCTPKKKKRVSA
jgi:hypothetical protein